MNSNSLRRFGLIATLLLTAWTPDANRTVEIEQIRVALANQYETQATIKEEAHVLAIAGEHAVRLSDTLRLVLTDKQSQVLKDDDSGCPGRYADLKDVACYRYVLMAYLPSEHVFLVGKFTYEGADYFLIDERTGKSIRVPAVPLFSPDHRYFIVIDNSEAGGNTGLVQIWRRHDDGAKIEWQRIFESGNGADAQCSVQSWVGDTITLDVADGSHPELRLSANLKHDAVGWHLTTAAHSKAVREE